MGPIEMSHTIPPFVTATLLIFMGVVYWTDILLGGQLYDEFHFSPLRVIYEFEFETIFISPFVHNNMFQFLCSVAMLIHFRKTELTYGSQHYLIILTCIHLLALTSLTTLSYLFFRVTGWRWYSLYFHEPFRASIFGFVPTLAGMMVFDFDRNGWKTWAICSGLVLYAYLGQVYFGVVFGLLAGLFASFFIREKEDILKTV